MRGLQIPSFLNLAMNTLGSQLIQSTVICAKIGVLYKAILQGIILLCVAHVYEEVAGGFFDNCISRKKGIKVTRQWWLPDYIKFISSTTTGTLNSELFSSASVTYFVSGLLIQQKSLFQLEWFCLGARQTPPDLSYEDAVQRSRNGWSPRHQMSSQLYLLRWDLQ